MVDPVTTNRSLAVPTHGSDVDTWDAPVNANMALLDTIVGGVLNISTTGGTFNLNAAQLACGTIVVTGALAGGVTLVFPNPGIQGWWTIGNFTTNTSNNVAVISGNQSRSLCIPPGEYADIQINVNTPAYRNLARIGSYFDLAATAVPPWITGQSIPPYLLCDGSAFDGSVYPYLAAMIGANLPDFRGRGSFFLNGGTGRLTAGGAGINGDILGSVGGANGVTLAVSQIPSLTSVNASQGISVTSTATVPRNYSSNTVGTPGTGTPVSFPTGNNIGLLTSSDLNSISVTYTNASQQIVGNAPPGIVSGIRLIRAG